jgi:Spy/CpxP family protein refolding chaperone
VDIKHNKARKWVGPAVSVALVGMVAAGITFAQGQPGPPPQGPMMQRMGPMGPMFGPGMMMRGAFRQLGLTQDQLTKVKAILESHQAEAQPLIQPMIDARQALNAAVDANDPGAIKTAVEGLAGLQVQMATLRAKIRAEIFSQVLTQEQRDKAKTLEGQWQQRLGQRRMQHQGPGTLQ